MTRLFGIVVMSTTATFRKSCSIILSFLIFPKPFVFGHFVAVVLVFSGVLTRLIPRSSDSLSRITKLISARFKMGHTDKDLRRMDIHTDSRTD